MTRSGWMIRDGLRLAIHSRPGTDPAAGPPLVFQHGLGGNAGQVAEALQGLPGPSWQMLECRGHGPSDLGEDLSIDCFAKDVAAMIEPLGAPVVLGGISMGAAISCRIAVLRPDLVRALILVRPAWVTNAGPANMAPNAEVGALLDRLPPAEARAAFAKGMTAQRLAQTAPDNLASLMGFFDRPPAAATARLLTAISADGPGITVQDLAQLALPTLICATTEDEIHPLTHAQDLARMIPGARFALLPPKAQDKPAHLAAMCAAMSLFLQEI